MQPVKVGEHLIGPGHPVYCVGEIGINHNADMAIIRKLISAAAVAGCQAVKFQKRTVEVVYSPEELAKPRESPWGTTNGDQKRGLELTQAHYDAIGSLCSVQDIDWFASCWDEASVDFIEQFDPPAYKIASASLTDLDLLHYTRSMGRPIILSTGMSTLAEIDRAVECLGTQALILLHCTSTYPCEAEELNLRCIPVLGERYGVPVGFSDHSPGLPSVVAAVAMGACMIEKHITVARTLYGSDQAASVEPHGLMRMVREIRFTERALGTSEKIVYLSEEPIKAKLRRKDLVNV